MGDSEAMSQFIKFHSNYQLLILDEVGASYGSEMERIQFNRLIDDFYRKGEGQKMIIITNITEKNELEKYLSKPAYSRICEEGIILNFTGADWRKDKKTEVII